MKSPETYQTEIMGRENTVIGSRIAFKKEPGKVGLVAEIIPTGKKGEEMILNCSWLCDRSLRVENFKEIVEGKNDVTEWSEMDGTLWCKLAGVGSFWFCPMSEDRVPKVGFKTNVVQFSDAGINNILKTTKTIALATIKKQDKLPPNLTGTLRAFVALSLNQLRK